MPSRTVLILIIAGVLLGAVGLVVLNFGPKAAPGSIRDGDRDFWKLPAVGGGPATGPADYRGKVVLVNFWATWCGYCVEEMPAMDRAARARADRAVVLAVNVREPESKVESFLAGKGYSYRVLLDTDGRVAARYGVRAFPTTLVFDRDGKLIGKVEGAMKEDAFMRLIDEAAK